MEEIEIVLETENNQEQEITLFSENISYAGGTSNYLDLENKPSINGVELIGNKTTEDLGIEAGKEVYIGNEEPTGEETIWIDTNETPDTIPTKTSQLENDSKFITNEALSEYSTTKEIQQMISKIDIPTRIGDLENDINVVTKDYVDELVGDIESLLGGI